MTKDFPDYDPPLPPLPPPTTPPGGCGHNNWRTKSVKDYTDQIIVGSVRTCKTCGQVQYADYAQGRHGGDYKVMPQTP